MNYRKNFKSMDPLAASTLGAEVAEKHSKLFSQLTVDSGNEVSLPWNNGVRLLQLQDSQSKKQVNILYKDDDGDSEVLDGTSKPIYEMNKKAGFNLLLETVGGYTKLFLDFVAGCHGTFEKVDAVEEVLELLDEDSRNDMTVKEIKEYEAKYKQCKKLIQPEVLLDNADGVTRKEYVLFKAHIFEMATSISKNGVVKLGKSKPIIGSVFPLYESIEIFTDIGFSSKYDAPKFSSFKEDIVESPGDAYWSDSNVLRRSELGMG